MHRLLILLILASAVTVVPVSAEKVKRSSSGCWISVESVLKKLNKEKEIQLVDVRPKSDFEKIRIPSSINIPLFAVKTKAFLKRKDLQVYRKKDWSLSYYEERAIATTTKRRIRYGKT